MTTDRHGMTALAYFILATIIVAVLMSVGCVHTEVDLPNNGGHFSRTSFLSNQTVGDLDVHTQGPEAGVKLSGYGSNQTEAVAAIVSAAIKAAK